MGKMKMTTCEREALNKNTIGLIMRKLSIIRKKQIKKK